MVLALIATSCVSDGSSTISDVYTGTASHGDLVTFRINKTDQIYQVNNHTANQTASASYGVMTGLLGNVYKTFSETSSLYAVELDGVVLATNFPTGNFENKISFGITTAINNTGRESLIAGDYIYIRFGSEEINGSLKNKEWGVISVLPSGTLYTKAYASGGDQGQNGLPPLTPDKFNLSLPLTSGDLQGSWSVNSTEKVKLDVEINGVQYTAFSYAATSSSVFLLDLGAGNGYILGLKVSPASISLAQLVGSYNFVGVVADGTGLAGNTRIASDGSATCAIETNGVLSEDESFTGIQQCPNLPNVLCATHLDPRYPSYRGKAYFVISGDIMMYFIFDTDGFFNAYGAGVKIM